MSPKRKADSLEELGVLAEGLRGLLAAIEDGSMKADPGTIARIEGLSSTPSGHRKPTQPNRKLYN